MLVASTPEIIVVGAGAVGLMVGNLLGQKNIPTLILEKCESPRDGSRAIGITPPSLDLLASLGLAEPFQRAGVRVGHAVLHGEKKVLGALHFDCLPSAHRFILSLPQETAERLLLENLSQYASVVLRRGLEVVGLQWQTAGVAVEVLDRQNGKKQTQASRLLCACDGKQSTVRSLLGHGFPGKRYKQTFLMGDFVDQSGLGETAHLFFNPLGPVESFPLPGGKRRWIVETKTFAEKPAAGFLEQEIFDRTGFAPNPADKCWESPFGTQRHLARKYFEQSVLFCGDAAHIMSPIGGQGMNTGWGDAEFAVAALALALARPAAREGVFKAYQFYRQKAFRTAARRAAQLMRLGTWKGQLLSAIRNPIIQLVVKLFPQTVARYFSMLSIPYRSLAQVLEKEPSLFKNDQFNESKK
jgi:2-polyprenyl-6-methoxyphenol hydroxylase-like FAD-dependent oxidoreductase